MTRMRRALGTIVAATLAMVLLHVRAGADAPPGHYTDLGDGTVRDNETGLVWQQVVDATLRNQAGAISYCDGLTLAGRSDWRLPHVLELRSIVDETRASPAIDPTFFPGSDTADFWSASPVAGSPSDGWHVYFRDGQASNWLVTEMLHARCVR